MTPELRNLVGTTGAAWTTSYLGRNHLVIPVVALMDGVIHAINAPTAERVTAGMLTHAAKSWDGKPLCFGHPVRDGRQISAAEAGVADVYAFGVIQNSRMSGSKLLMDAYVDPVRAEKLGGAEFLRRLQTGQPPCDVSVGAFVSVDQTPGTFNGRAYEAVWRETHGDHLAFLTKTRGACDQQMGCGTHRAAQADAGATIEGAAGVVVPGTAIEPVIQKLRGAMEDEKRTLAQRLLGLFHFKSAAASYTDLQESLTEALRAVVPGFLCVDSVYLDDTVVYMTGSPLVAGPGEPNDMCMFRRSFTADKNGEVTLEDDAEEVEAVTTYEPKAAAAKTAMTDCPTCEGLGQVDGKDCPTCDGEGEVPMKTAEEMRHAANPEGINQYTKGGGSKGGYPEGEGRGKGGRGPDKEEAYPGKFDKGSKLSPKEASFAKQAVGELDLTDEGLEGNETDKDIDGIADDVLFRGSYSTGQSIVDAFGSGPNGPSKKAERVIDEVRSQVVGQLKDMRDFLKESAARNAEALRAAEGKEQAQSPCGCPAEHRSTNRKENTMKDRVKALIACSKNPFTEADAPWLDAIPETHLEALASSFDKTDLKAAEELATKAAADLKAAEELKALAEKPKTEEEFLATAPESIRTLVADKKAQDEAQKGTLVTALKTAQSEYSEDELKAMDLKSLRRLANVASVEQPDYSGRGVVPNRTAAEADVYRNPPDGYALAIAAQKQ